RSQQAEARLAKLEADNIQLREENAALRLENTRLKLENQLLRDKRKISGGTMSQDGRVARDVMLGLMKTCQKLGLSFYHYLGDRLGIGTG
ncbi:hypothetical protein ELH83_35540, partial [Rhizobium leguminosarum]